MPETNVPEPTKFEVVTNIFEALDIPNAEHETARCELVGRIFQIGRDRNLSDRQLAKMAGCTYERMSQLRAVDFDDVTIDELCGYLVALGHGIRIVVEPELRTDAHLTVES
ncbi:MAG: XRE family transcriptional regulator [Candidatus Hydrogenedentes bacterium]|nr:XRE family transcriptional regulator [Candidatus Hydrogenedentota bacterium]